jgi:hypothetical protein
MPCNCVSCNPHHNPLKGKTKGKKAKLQLPDKFEKKPRLRKSTRKDKRLGNP